MDAKPVRLSQSTITELMIPSYANFGGKIHGGILLSLMDKVAYVCATQHAATYCVTVTVDRVEFLHPVEVGDLVSLHASVNYVGRTSMIIGIRVEALKVKTGVVTHTNSSYFTMVAKGEDDRPALVPELILESEDDIRRFLEALRMRQVRSQVNEQLDDANSTPDIRHARNLLQGERCRIEFAGV